MTRKKRFIAGAECPKCHTIDTIVLLDDEVTKVFECVACGFSESMLVDIDKPNSKSENVIQWINIKD